MGGALGQSHPCHACLRGGGKVNKDTFPLCLLLHLYMCCLNWITSKQHAFMQSYKIAAIVLLSKFFQLLCEEKLVYFQMIHSRSHQLSSHINYKHCI